MKYQIISGRIIRRGIPLLFILIFIYLGYELQGATMAFALGIISGMIVSFYYLQKTFPIIKSKMKSISVTKDLLKFSWPLMFASYLALIMGWSDTIILGVFVSPLKLGIYQAALPTAVMLSIFLNSFSRILLPVISEAWSNGEIDQIKKTYSIATKWVFASIFPFFMLIILFPSQILKILFGPEYGTGALTLVIISIGYFSFAIFGLSMNAIISIGKTKVNLLINGISAITNIILNLILIPIYGILGAGIAISISLTLRSLLSFILLQREVKINPFTIEYLKIIFSGIITIIPLYYLVKVTDLSKWFLLAIIPLFLIFYVLIFLYTHGLDEGDILILKSMERKTGIKLKWLRNLIKKFI